MKNHTEVEVVKLPMCDVCEVNMVRQEAQYDSRLKQGMWANTCEMHFQLYGVGLGLGKGQRLITS